MYWIKLIKDIRLWMRFAKVAKQNREYLEKHNLRVDKLGRIYTVINLPEEIRKTNEYMHEAWVLQNLTPFTQVLLEIGVADYAYPEVSRIDESDADAYLVVMYPEAEAVSFRKIIWNLFLWTAGFFVLKTIYKLIVASPVIMEYLHKAIDFIF